MLITLDEALDLVERLSRTKNYPKDGVGVTQLAEGLRAAAEQTGISGEAIIARCAADSPWCPCDFDLLTVAKDIARENAVVRGTYDSTAKSGNHHERRQPCATCGNTGWETIYTLHTPVNGNWKQAKRENITMAAYDEISQKMNKEIWDDQQRVYSGARRCAVCSPKVADAR